jgi:hypothetical protein
LLWLVSQVDLSLLRTFKRVQNFVPADVSVLRDLTERRAGFATTPHVLAETNNFLDSAPPYRRNDLLTALEIYIRSADEHREPATALVRDPSFRRLGLTDTGLAMLSSSAVVVTTDMKLANFIHEQSGKVYRFVSERRAG